MSSLKPIMSGEPLPIPPKFENREHEAYFRKLTDYLRRLAGVLNAYNTPGAGGGGPVDAPQAFVSTLEVSQDRSAIGGYFYIEWTKDIYYDSLTFGHSISENPEEIQVKRDGVYLIAVDTLWQSATQTSVLDVAIEVYTEDPEGIPRWFTVEYSPAFGLPRSPTSATTETGGFVVAVPMISGVLFRVRVREHSTAAGGTLYDNGTRISVVRVDVKHTDLGIGWDGQPPSWLVIAEQAIHGSPPPVPATVDKTFVVVTLDSDLTNERQLVGESGVVTIVDNGAGGTIEVKLASQGVSYAKMQATGSSDVLLGRQSTGAGAVEEITCTAAARSILDDATVDAMLTTLGGVAYTGSGGVARATSPTFVTPTLGVATATSVTMAGASIPSTPASGTLSYYTDTFAVPCVVDSNGTKDPLGHNPRRIVWVFDTHFMSGSLAAEGLAGSGSGGATQAVTGSATHPGLMQMVVQNTGNYAWWGCNATQVLFGGGYWFYWCYFRINALSTAGDRFTLILGFHDSQSAAEPTDGFYLIYSDDINSGKFQYTTRNNGAGNETASDSGLTAAANTWYLLELAMNEAGTSASGTINGANGGTITTNIPTGAARVCLAGGCMFKESGVNWVSVDMDFARCWCELTTAL